jgi:hypothetical protein
MGDRVKGQDGVESPVRGGAHLTRRHAKPDLRSNF